MNAGFDFINLLFFKKKLFTLASFTPVGAAGVRRRWSGGRRHALQAGGRGAGREEKRIGRGRGSGSGRRGDLGGPRVRLGAGSPQAARMEMGAACGRGLGKDEGFSGWGWRGETETETWGLEGIPGSIPNYS